jgi:hypothetical protein
MTEEIKTEQIMTGQTTEPKKEITKIPYRPLIVTEIADLIGKYRELSSYEAACKLLVDEELLILKKASVVNEQSA